MKWYHNIKHSTLMAKLLDRKHELKVTSQFLRNKKLIARRNSINKKFQLNQKNVSRDWRNKKISIKTTHSKTDIETFWSSIWTKSSTHNGNATWLKTLEENYYKNVTLKDYQINIRAFKEILTSMKNNGTPGPDKINAYAIKKLPRTYTFLENHCTTNNVITMKQAGGKKYSWGCADQLLINKMVLGQVKQQQKNLFIMWFDYQKVLHTLLHSWITKALHFS